jgi:hypothetical protein
VVEYVAFEGRSGKSYSYMPLEHAPDLARRAGNYVMAERKAGGWRLLDAGEADDLGARPWAATPDPAKVFIRLNVSRTAREQELSDLVAARATPTTQALAS